MVDITPEYLGGYPIVEAEYRPYHPFSPTANFHAKVYSERFGENAIMLSWVTQELADDPIAFRRYLLMYLEDLEERRAAKEKRAKKQPS